MSKQGLTATPQEDTAVSLQEVSKVFWQWQRETGAKRLIKNLFSPEKRVISALNEVSFEVNYGEIVAYAGPNGAGKSTTMKLLAGMLLPTKGEIAVLGMSPYKQRIRVMQRLGVLFGNRTELWWDHPVKQSFEWKRVVWEIPDATYQRNLALVCELLEIGGLLGTFARELSLGQRMRADLAMMLLHSPSLILLDEPTLGLDVVAKRQMIAFLKRINKEEGVTILVSSHDMDDLEEMAERILMISQGKIAYDGNFDGLREITGMPAHIRLTMESGIIPNVPMLDVQETSNGIFEFEVDISKLPIKELLGILSQVEGIRDVEIRKAPIEQVIAELYRTWS